MGNDINILIMERYSYLSVNILIDGTTGRTYFIAGSLPCSVTTDDTEDDPVRVWLVERTFSDDEQNLIILTYATPDGRQYHRKERAVTSIDDVPETTAAVSASPQNLGRVVDADERRQYAAEAQRMADTHDPDDVI